MKTVADQQFAEVLATAEAKRIYGIVRDSLNGLTDANRRHGRIGRIHVRDAEVAAFVAGVEARRRWFTLHRTREPPDNL